MPICCPHCAYPELTVLKNRKRKSRMRRDSKPAVRRRVRGGGAGGATAGAVADGGATAGTAAAGEATASAAGGGTQRGGATATIAAPAIDGRAKPFQRGPT